MRSSYTVLKLFLVFEIGCSSLGLRLDIITFLPCFTREDCSFLHMLLLVSDLDVSLNSSSSRASTSELLLHNFLPFKIFARFFQVHVMVVVGSGQRLLPLLEGILWRLASSRCFSEKTSERLLIVDRLRLDLNFRDVHVLSLGILLVKISSNIKISSQYLRNSISDSA